MKIKDIIEFTESFAPLNSAMEFDNVGLLIGSENNEVKKGGSRSRHYRRGYRRGYRKRRSAYYQPPPRYLQRA